MLGDMLGVPVSSHGTLAQAWEILQGLPGSNLPTLALSALVAGSILLGKRFAPRIPLSLFAVAGTIGASAVFHFAERGIAVIGPVPGVACDRAALRDLERSPDAAAGRRIGRCDDHRAKCRDITGIRPALPRTRQ